MQKHTYTEELAPRNTGSVMRPARFNLRLTCQARARTLKALAALRLRRPSDDGSDARERRDHNADTWERVALPLLEALIRDMKREGMLPEEYLRELLEAERAEKAGRREPGQMRFDF